MELVNKDKTHEKYKQEVAKMKDQLAFKEHEKKEVSKEPQVESNGEPKRDAINLIYKPKQSSKSIKLPHTAVPAAIKDAHTAQSPKKRVIKDGLDISPIKKQKVTAVTPL